MFGKNLHFDTGYLMTPSLPGHNPVPSKSLKLGLSTSYKKQSYLVKCNYLTSPKNEIREPKTWIYGIECECGDIFI